MRLFLLLVIPLIFCTLSFGQRTIANYGLKGKLMLVYEYCYDVVPQGDIFSKSDKFSEERYFFNSSGYLTAESSFGYSKNLMMKFIYKLNKDNKIERYEFTGSSGTSYSLYSYGNKTKTLESYNVQNELNRTEKYVLDDYGNPVQQQNYKKDGQPTPNLITTDYIYDESGNMLDKKLYYDSVLRYHSAYKYNADNQLIEHKDYSPEKELKRTETFKYDALGNMTEWLYIYSKPILYQYVYEYNEQNV